MLRSIDPGMVMGTPSSAEQSLAGGLPASAIQAVELWPENLAYLKASGLGPGSGEELMAHFKSLNTRFGVLFDLRGAGGEDLKSACVLAGLARPPQEPIFILTNNRGVALETNLVSGVFARFPLLMILVDGETSGASEALVSVLKGGAGVMLVGTPTSGGASLRDWLLLPGGRTVWLTTRKWKLASGHPPEDGGIRPDIRVAANSGIWNEGLSRTNLTNRALSVKSDSDKDLMMRVSGDAALQRATDILLGIQAVDGYERN